MANHEETNGTSKKKKIVVLGAGPSGLSALFELTNYPGWEALYDVTVYQFGWQLGGKCRTGRGDKDRIEEHGIHIFLGFYNNAMRTIRQAHEECIKRGIQPKGSPFGKNWEDLFHKQSSILLPEYRNGKWDPWTMVFPQNEEIPGVGEAPSHHTTVKKMFLLMLELILGSPYGNQNPGILGRIKAWIIHRLWPKEASDPIDQSGPKEFANTPGVRPAGWEKHKAAAEKKFGHVDGPHKYLHYAKTMVEQMPVHETHAQELHKSVEAVGHPTDHMLHLMHTFMSGFELLFHRKLKNDDNWRRFWLLTKLGYYNLVGMNKIYDTQTGTYDFDKINHLDYREWLLLNGAPEDVVWSAPVKDIYTLVFAYPKGDTSQAGQIAAGTALQGAMLIVLGYKGSVMYRFHGGTADVALSPIYKVLEARGVKFKFFHHVKEVAYSEGKDIEKITIDEQIRLKNPEKPFQAIRNIKGLDCWAAHPFWRWDELADQIHPEDLEGLKKDNINLNSHWSGWKNAETHELVKGRDFDHVILSVSIDSLKYLCKDIVEKKKAWNDMVENVQTVQTQGVQLWFKPTLEQLGMNLSAMGLKPNDQPVTDTYANPNNSYADFSELLRFESWGNEAGSIAYFCGPFSEPDVIPPSSDTTFPESQHLRVREQLTQWLSDNAGFLWPKGVTPENPSGVDLDLLADPIDKPGASGIDKLNRQYFTANIDPSERYVLSLPGSAKFRLKADASGYDNLFLAGDWIDTGYNMGCAEVAFMSGLMAAQALREKAFGITKHEPILKDL